MDAEEPPTVRDLRVERQRAWIALGIALTVQAVLLVAAMGDFVASDPLSYATTAHRIAVAPWTTLPQLTPHPFDMRIGMTVPLALLYRAFGVSVLVSNLPAMVAALVITAVVWAAAPTARAKLIGLVIALSSVALVRHGALLLPDLPCAALLACATLALARRGLPRGSAWLVGGMLAWVAAFLVKETALWLGPVWIYAIVVDVRAASIRTAARRHGPALALGMVLGGAYLVVSAHVWGSPFARFHGIDALAGEHTWTLLGQPASAWLARLTWQPLVLFAKLAGIAIVPAALAAWLVRGPARIWVVATAVLAALFWWGSTSLSTYAPLALRPRMALPVLPGVLVLATLATDALFDRLGRQCSRRVRVGRAVGLVLLFVLPALRPLAKTLAADAPETAAYVRVRQEATAPDSLLLVAADRRGTWVAPIYLGFGSRVRVVAARDLLATPPPPATRVLVIANFDRAREFAADGDAGMMVAIRALALPTLTAAPGLALYDAGDGTRLWAMLRACATCSSSP